MNHPPSEDYFGTVHAALPCHDDFFFLFQVLKLFRLSLPPSSGRCARCGDNVVGDGSGCVAMEQVFHVECFTCITCHAHLRGQPFYALDKKSYCESCYIVSIRGRLWCKFLPAAVVQTRALVSEYIGALFKVLQTHPGPDPASNGEGLPPSLLHVRGLQLLFGWRPLHRGRHLSDPLHRRLPSVPPHFHTSAQTRLRLSQHPLFFFSFPSLAASTHRAVQCVASPSCRSRVRRRR